MARKRRSLLGRKDEPVAEVEANGGAADEQPEVAPQVVGPPALLGDPPEIPPPDRPEAPAPARQPETADWRPPGRDAWSPGAWDNPEGIDLQGGAGWAGGSQDESWTAAAWAGPTRSPATTPPQTIADEGERGDGDSPWLRRVPPPPLRASGIQLPEITSRWAEDDQTDAATEPPPDEPRSGIGASATPSRMPPISVVPREPTPRGTPTGTREERPSYVADTPAPPPRAEAPKAEMWVRPDFDDDADEAVNADEVPDAAPWSPWRVGAAVGIGMIMSLGLILLIFLDWRQMAADSIPTPPEGAGEAGSFVDLGLGPRSIDGGGVEVRTGLRSPPRFDAVDPMVVREVERAAMRDPPDLRRPVTPTAAVEIGEVGDVGEVGGAVQRPVPTGTQNSQQTPVPVAKSIGEVGADAPPPPTPAPVVRPRPTEPDPATLGTLKIRANRRVLVYVDGKAIGYAPTDYLTTPGAHTVRAMLPGQPASAQTQSIDVVKAGSVVALDFAF